jgi:hypothetical protein
VNEKTASEIIAQMLKDLQRIKWLCQRAERWGMDDKDIKEMLEITKKY